MVRIISRLIFIVIILAILNIILYLGIEIAEGDSTTIDSGTVFQETLMPVRFEIVEKVYDSDDAFNSYLIEKSSMDRYREIRYDTAKDSGERIKIIQV